MALEDIIYKRKFDIGDQVYMNVTDGDKGTIVAMVVYSTHAEYLVRFKELGVIQLEEVSMSTEKIII